MKRFFGFSGLALVVAVACLHCGSDDEGGGTSTEQGAGGAGTAGSASGGSATGGSAGTSSSGSGSLGTECKKYKQCCEGLAAGQPEVAKGCSQGFQTIEDAVKKDPSTGPSYESACKQAVATVQSQGYCK